MSPSCLTAVTTEAHPALLGVQVQKGEIKLTACTSIPWSMRIFAASVLSSPPDKSPTALVIIRLLLEPRFKSQWNCRLARDTHWVKLIDPHQRIMFVDFYCLNQDIRRSIEVAYPGSTITIKKAKHGLSFLKIETDYSSGDVERIGMRVEALLETTLHSSKTQQKCEMSSRF
jgi:hypothetical protein